MRAIHLLSISAILALANCVVGGVSAAVGPARPDLLVGPLSVEECVVVAYGKRAATRIAAYDANGHLRWYRRYPGVSFAGEALACDGVVYAPAFRDGIYAFGARSGALRAHLLPADPTPIPLVACAPRRVFASVIRAGGSTVLAFDTRGFRQSWIRAFPGQNVSALRVRSDAVEVVVATGMLERPHDEQLITLLARDGREVSVVAAPEMPWEHQWDFLPLRARSALRRLFIRREGTQYVSTTILRLKGLLAVGRVFGPRPGVFVIGADTGRMIWQRDAPGLFGIALVRDIVVALFAARDAGSLHSADRLDAFDLRTGRLLWTVRLSDTP